MLKILLTVAIVFGWLVAMQANLMGAARTAATMQVRDGMTPGAAQRRTVAVTAGYALVATALAVWALTRVW